ncbi:MAG: sulfur carrier protein ThiS [Gammaproteobacteria bacterium]|nr:sulfur carrier protein ThiS [Gammaproteobacteria bacterium]
MNINVNGDVMEVEDSTTVEDLIMQLSLGNKRIAVEVNQRIITKSLHGSTKLTSNDTIEIIHAIGGG